MGGARGDDDNWFEASMARRRSDGVVVVEAATDSLLFLDRSNSTVFSSCCWDGVPAFPCVNWVKNFLKMDFVETGNDFEKTFPWTKVVSETTGSVVAQAPEDIVPTFSSTHFKRFLTTIFFRIIISFFNKITNSHVMLGIESWIDCVVESLSLSQKIKIRTKICSLKTKVGRKRNEFFFVEVLLLRENKFKHSALCVHLLRLSAKVKLLHTADGVSYQQVCDIFFQRTQQALSLSLSLSLTHTHTLTHSLTLSHTLFDLRHFLRSIRKANKIRGLIWQRRSRQKQDDTSRIILNKELG